MTRVPSTQQQLCGLQILQAMKAVKLEPCSACFTQLSSKLAAHLSTPGARQLLDLFTDASLALWTAARPLLDGVMCARDREAPLVATLLATVHATFEAVDLQDPILRCASS